MTNNKGEYSISNLLPGTYLIRINKDGIILKTQEIELYSNTLLDFGLPDYIEGGNNSRYINVASRRRRNYTFYLYPSDSRFKIYDWGYRIDKKRKSRDNGTYIDQAGNRLVIKVRLDGRWYRKAEYKAEYWVRARIPIDSINLQRSIPNVKEEINEIAKTASVSPSRPTIMLLNDESRPHIKRSGSRSSSLEEKQKIAILIKDVEEELTTASIKLSFNSDKMTIEDVSPPIFEDIDVKFVQKRIEEGRIEIEAVIIEKEDNNDSEGEETIYRSLGLEEKEEEDEENIAPIAYLIINLPQDTSLYKSPALDYQNPLSCISIDEVELHNKDGNVIKVKIEKNNLISPPQAESTLEKTYCYPNPTKGDEIVFDKLTNNVKVKIYNLAGELVYEEEWRDTNGSHKWECVNSHGKKLASGIYIYLLTDPDSNSTKKGKLGIIR